RCLMMPFPSPYDAGQGNDEPGPETKDHVEPETADAVARLGRLVAADPIFKDQAAILEARHEALRLGRDACSANRTGGPGDVLRFADAIRERLDAEEQRGAA